MLTGAARSGAALVVTERVAAVHVDGADCADSNEPTLFALCRRRSGCDYERGLMAANAAAKADCKGTAGKCTFNIVL